MIKGNGGLQPVTLDLEQTVIVGPSGIGELKKNGIAGVWIVGNKQSDKVARELVFGERVACQCDPTSGFIDIVDRNDKGSFESESS